MRLLIGIGGLAVVGLVLTGLWYLVNNVRFGDPKSPPTNKEEK